jgi:sporulation protein YlmC with PRC-barrel domain
MNGRRRALLLMAVLGLGGTAQADDAPPPAATPDSPATSMPEAPPAAPTVSTTTPDAPPAAPTVPAPPGDQPTPASPEPAQPPAQPDAASPPDASKAAPPPDVPKEEPPPEASKEEPKAPPKDVVQPPKNLEPIPKDTAITVLGKKVLGPEGEDMGRVTDLLLDRDGHIKSIVIDFGGFLGVGSRKIAIDWRLVRFVPDKPDAPIALSLGKTEVQAAPEYKDSAQPPVMVGPPPSGPDAAR